MAFSNSSYSDHYVMTEEKHQVCSKINKPLCGVKICLHLSQGFLIAMGKHEEISYLEANSFLTLSSSLVNTSSHEFN